MFIFCLCDVGYWISVKIRVHAVQKVKRSLSFLGCFHLNHRFMTLRWITTPSACQKLRFSTKSMLGILVRRTSIPLRFLQFSFVRHLMIHTVLMQSQLCWAGHVLCMPDHWLPKKLPFRELQHGKRSLGGQKKRFKDTLKVSLKAFSISYNSWEQAAMKRRKWRAAVCSGAESHGQQDCCS